jgi:hypothetical protein
MHKTFKNQTRYKLDKTPIKSRTHTHVWQGREISKLYQNTQINTWLKILLWKDTNEIKIPNWWKYHQGINQTLYTSHDGTKYQDEKCLSSKETRHWDQIPIEDNYCSKAYRIAPPRYVHYLWSFIRIQNAHKWDHHSSYI